MTKKALIEVNKKQNLEILELKQQLDTYKRMLFGSTSERYIPQCDGQLNLFETESSTPSVEATKDVVIEKHTRKKSNHKGRSLIAGLSHLPVTEIEIEVDHTPGSEVIGVVERSTLAYKPGKFYIHKEIIKKYKDSQSGKISPATFPTQPIDRCEAHISLLVYICIAKFVDHLPEYRLRMMFKRDGVIIPGSTMNGWVHKSADLLRPMADYIGTKILESHNIMVDESSIRVMDSKKNRTHTGWMWVIYSPALGCVQFMYHKGRTHDIPIKWLKNYSGKYQTDGYQGYDTLDIMNKNASHSNCNAHARRYFEKALDNDMPRASYAMSVYQKLYEVESQIRSWREENEGVSHELFYGHRTAQRKLLLPVIKQFKEWLDKNALEVLPKSLIGKAIAYVLARWEKLTKYITDGALEIDNNLIENTIRPLALGRKNFLFAGNHEAASNIAVFQSIFGTCKHMGINPADYLQWYLENVALTKINNIQSLSPWSYKKYIENKVP